MGVGQRRSGRIAKEIAIVLMGTDTAGRVFSEETRTVVLSRHGAGILSKYRLAPDEILTMRFSGGTAEVAVRLVGEMGKDARGYTYGIAFVDPDLDFWELKFPPPPQYPGGGMLALECSLCQARDVVDQTEVEADVFALAGYILRFCAKCETSTEWKRASGAEPSPSPPISIQRREVRPEPREEEATGVGERERLAPEVAEEGGAPAVTGYYSSAPPELVTTASSGMHVAPAQVTAAEKKVREALPPAATAVVARTANRRRDVRTRVSFTACIRLGTSEDLVECDNVSRGGLSFRSRKGYAVGTLIEVAVPYSPGAPAIFVSASIRHVRTIASGSLFRYGAAYMRKGAGDPQVQPGY
jgi:hypothetical protein